MALSAFFVCLQDDSREPGLAGRPYEEAKEHLLILAKLAEHRGAVPVLFLTWGYANGDSERHHDVYPDFLTMQVPFPEAFPFGCSHAGC